MKRSPTSRHYCKVLNMFKQLSYLVLASVFLTNSVACDKEDDESEGETMEAVEAMETQLCTNANDMGLLDVKFGMKQQEPEQLAAECSVICYFDPARLECITGCIVEGTELRLSEGCSRCLALAAECASAHCAEQCSIDPNAPECIGCRCGYNAVGQNCETLYEECSGVLSPVCRGG